MSDPYRPERPLDTYEQWMRDTGQPDTERNVKDWPYNQGGKYREQKSLSELEEEWDERFEEEENVHD